MEKENLSENDNQIKNDNVTVSKKTIYIITAVLAVVLITGGWVYFNKNKNNNSVKNRADSTKVSKKDSANIASDSAKLSQGYEEGEESPYSEYRVISKTINLPEGKLNFGDRVFVDENKSNETTKIIYLKNPGNNSNVSSYSMNADQFIDGYRFEEYKTNFSLFPFSDLPSGVKKIILNEGSYDGNHYNVTQNAERAKSSVAFGDFDGDGLKDVAIIMDNNEKQICRLLVICTNKETKQPYVAFADTYSDKMRVRGFKKNASIYMDSTEFVNAPQDGIVIKGEDNVLAVVYNPEFQKFKTYAQAPLGEAAVE